MASSLNLEPVRVLAVILDDKEYPELFKKHGEWASIGGIIFEFVKQPTKDKNLLNKQFAAPLYSNIKHLPVEHEIVLVVQSSDSGILDNLNSFSYYYLPPTNVWANSHHNAVPDQILAIPGEGDGLPDRSRSDYVTVGDKVVRQIDTNGTEIFKPGDPFTEFPYISTLTPYPGDLILEGRWGNSLRFSSTNSDYGLGRNWGNYLSTNPPITILRNGVEPNLGETKPVWETVSEDINKDYSSIYLTSEQKIPLKPSAFRTTSFEENKTPISIPEFRNPQIILSSDRLVFNASQDSILNCANKTFTVTSNESINLQTKKTVVESQEVLLGSKDAEERLIKGDTFVKEMLSFLNAMKQVQRALGTATVPSTDPLTGLPVNIPIESLVEVSTMFGASIDKFANVLGKVRGPMAEVSDSTVLSNTTKTQ